MVFTFVRYHCGNAVHVRAIKSIKVGLPIFENYGPLYTQEERSKRQSSLKDLYQFECTCDACLENWPTFDGLNNKIIRFRCDAANNCCAVIKIDPDEINNFQVKCSNCNDYTNTFKGFKALQVNIKLT